MADALDTNLDLLNTTLEGITAKDWCIAFQKAIPLADYLMEKKAVNKATLGGRYWEYLMVYGGSGSGVAVYGGTEAVAGIKRQSTILHKVESHEILWNLDIPKGDLERNAGSAGIIKLVEIFPRAQSVENARDLNKWILAGTSAMVPSSLGSYQDLEGLGTLNSQFTGAKRTGIANGLLAFDTPAGQTSTAASIQSNVRDSAKQNYNQYGDTASWAASGPETLGKTYDTAAEYDPMKSGCDLMIADPDSFVNVEQYNTDRVRLASATGTQATSTKPNETLFKNAVVKRDSDLDRTLFTGNPADGVIYGVHGDWIEFDYIKMPKPGPFKDWNPRQRLVTAIMEFHAQLLMTRPNVHFAFTGAASA